MADFRILLPDSTDESAACELDWDRESGVWTRSEREYGTSRWDMGLPARPLDLRQILEFFRLDSPDDPAILARMGPGDCVAAHYGQHGSQDLIGALCPECGLHWHVYRREDDGRWYLYGRTCDFSWFRALEADPLEDDRLANLLRGSEVR